MNLLVRGNCPMFPQRRKLPPRRRRVADQLGIIETYVRRVTTNRAICGRGETNERKGI